MSSSSSQRGNLLVAVDGSTFEIDELINQTLRCVYRPGDTVFLIRVQGRPTSYDDHLLKSARRACVIHQVPSVEILIHADTLKSSHIADKLLSYAASIDARFLVMGKNDTRRGGVVSSDDAVDVALRRADRPLLCVNFAPELTRAPNIDD